jgi:hypothetical protein
MWLEQIPSNFTSRIVETDEASSGKWLVPVSLNDPTGLWARLQDLAWRNRIAAVKISAPPLDDKLGHHLVCVYCAKSDRDVVTSTLLLIRDAGFVGECSYKSDRATLQNREDRLWTSSQIEGEFSTSPCPRG